MAKKLEFALTVDDKGSIKIKQFGKNAKKSMNDADKSAKALSKSLSKSLAPAIAAGTVAMVALGTAIYKSARIGAEFQKTMAMVGAVSGATSKEFKDLEAQARKMGATTEWSATQSAEALKFLSMAGLQAQDSIIALPGMLDLATAAQMDLAQASDIVTDVLTAFGMKTSELTRLSDAFIATSTKSNTTVQMLGESFKYVAPIAAQMGFDVEQTAAYLGVLANSGIKASMAGTDLRAMMLKTSKAAKELGLDAGATLNEVLKEMAKRQLSANEASEMFGLIASKSALVLMNNVEAVGKMNTALRETSGITKKVAGVMRDTLDVDIKTLNSTMAEMGLTMFSIFGDDLRSAVQELTELIKESKGAFEGLGAAASATFKGASWILKQLRTDFHAGAEYSKYDKGWLGNKRAKDDEKLYHIPSIIPGGTEQLQAVRGIKAFEQKQVVVAPPPGIDHKMGIGDQATIDPDPFGEAFDIDYGFDEVQNGIDNILTLRNNERLALEQNIELQKRMSEAIGDTYTDQGQIDEYNQIRLGKQQEFDLLYEEMGLNRFDLERLRIERMAELYEQAGVDKNKIDQLVSERSKKIAQDEQKAKLSIYQNVAGGIANTFKSIAQAGGEQSKKAFKMYKAFAMVEAAIAGYKAALMAMSAYPPPISFVMAKIAGAAAAVQIGMIAKSQPPSYDQGGVSQPGEIYQTGPIRELHIPMSGKVPVNMDSNSSGNTFNVTLNNPVFQDLETQRRVMSQIASIIAAKVAPGAIVKEYNNDGPVRRIIRGGI